MFRHHSPLLNQTVPDYSLDILQHKTYPVYQWTFGDSNLMKCSITTYVTKPPSAVEIRTLVPLEGMEEQCHNVIAPEFAQGGDRST